MYLSRSLQVEIFMYVPTSAMNFSFITLTSLLKNNLIVEIYCYCICNNCKLFKDLEVLVVSKSETKLKELV